MLRVAWLLGHMLHPVRRALVRSRLREMDLPRRVLFVCYGNVCRSPFAAAQFGRACGDWHSGAPDIRSAGFIGPNRPPPPEAVAAAERAGVDLTSHRSSLFTADDVRAADLIVVMAPNQARRIRRRVRDSAPRLLVLGDLDPVPAASRTIVDPWGQPAVVFEESYRRITRCVTELARLLESGAVPSTGTQSTR